MGWCFDSSHREGDGPAHNYGGSPLQLGFGHLSECFSVKLGFSVFSLSHIRDIQQSTYIWYCCFAVVL